MEKTTNGLHSGLKDEGEAGATEKPPLCGTSSSYVSDVIQCASRDFQNKTASKAENVIRQNLGYRNVKVA